MTEAKRASTMPPRRVASKETELMRRLARATPAGLMMYDTAAQLNAPPHVQYVNRVLIQFMADVRAGKDPRVILNEPPRHGKTTIAGNYFPAWAVGNWPDLRIGYGGYSMDFARVQGGKARDILQNHGKAGSRLWDVEIREDAEAQHAWSTPQGGGMRTAGRGGAWTGFGFDVLLFDDLVKDAKEARSTVVMEHAFDWLRSTARTRVQPGGGILAIGTRWSKLDPVGRLIEAQQQADWDGDVFTVINLPALAEEHDPLGRAVGEPLCPEWGWTVDRFRKLRASIGSIWFTALYQGNPTPDEGALFRRSWMRYFTRDDANGVYRLHDPNGERLVPIDSCQTISMMDPAATEGEQSAFTAIGTWAITPMADLLLLEMVRERVQTTRHRALIDGVRARWRPSIIGVEKGAYGFHVIQSLAALGYPLKAMRADKDKVARAMIAQARYEIGKVYHPRSQPAWLAAYETELLDFPLGEFKDQVDVTAYASSYVAFGVEAQGGEPLDVASLYSGRPPPDDKFSGSGDSDDGIY